MGDALNDIDGVENRKHAAEFMVICYSDGKCRVVYQKAEILLDDLVH
jgi:hypothetical protein